MKEYPGIYPSYGGTQTTLDPLLHSKIDLNWTPV
jgi:hypothetical protein